MKGGPRAATALQRRRLDSTCGTTHPGDCSIPLGGQEHPGGAGSTLGVSEPPLRGTRSTLGCWKHP